jgi:hypothetical protein
MKYIITEDQFKTAEQAIRAYRLEQTILQFFDDQLSPFDGWDSPQSYKRELEENRGELFIYIVDVDGPDLSGDNDDFMWYSLCDNENLSKPIPEGHCPVVVLPRPKYGALDGYFGENNWKVFFKRWFMGHTGLDVVQVDRN